jgi:tetratricopeptide (TPR) repeat protein
MAIKGSLREASLPDVLQLLAMGQKTGCLSVTDRSNFGYIYFDRGRISYASIVNRRDRLGDVLVKNGAITQAQLEEVIQAQGRQRQKRLGELLVEQQMLSREVLHRFIRVQIEEAVYFLFTWTQGTFSFEADVRPDERDLLVSINPETLLLEGARRVDEWSLIEKKIPAFDVIFDVDRGRLTSADVNLTPEQERLLPLIDGQRDVHALIDASGMGEFDVGKALYGLATAGFLPRVGRSRPAEELSRDARVEEHRNLGVAFYRTGMLEEASREFRRVLELRDGDLQAHFYLALVAMREDRWQDAVELLERAGEQQNARPGIFHNLAFALEQLGDLKGARAALDEAVMRGAGDDPRVQTSLGVISLKLGDVEEADATLASARALWGRRPPSGSWFHFAGLAAALAGDLERARALVVEGVQLHPRVGPLHATLAAILERTGDLTGAAQAAERGIAEDGRLPQLYKLLGDCLYAEGRYEEALDAYQRGLKLDPELGDDIYFKIGSIRYKWQETDAAVSFWERALELNPTNELVRTNLDLVRSVT